MARFEEGHVLHLTVVFVLCYTVWKWIIHPFFLKTLSAIPQALSSALLTPAWILYHRYYRQANEAVDLAHRERGPIIRTAPNEINVNCVESGMHTIYDGGFDRRLKAGDEKGKEMERWMWQFGGGGRGCLGQHFATLRKYRSLSCELFTPIPTSTLPTSSPFFQHIHSGGM